MIVEDRDPAFWTSVFEHPQVKPWVGLGFEADFATLMALPNVIPLRAEHGGFLFVRLDGPGRLYELHTMFTPEGWGREVLCAALEAFSAIFARGAQLITTYEIEGNWRSRPPRTFRFMPCGDFEPVDGLPAALRTWSLSKAHWDASPARLRMNA